MALTVREIMNPETFTVKASDTVEVTLATMLGMGLSAAPVVDNTGRPEGMVSWRDLVNDLVKSGKRIDSRMSRPAATVRDTDLIETAGRLMAVTGYHHAPVVNGEGVVVGFVSLLDVVRGMLGIPAGHPGLFPHYDQESGVVWTDDRMLEESNIDGAPEGAGVIALIHGGKNMPETVAWAESTNNVRTRLLDLLSEPQPTPRLARWLDKGELRFRAAGIADADKRKRVAELLMRRARYSMWIERIGD